MPTLVVGMLRSADRRRLALDQDFEQIAWDARLRQDTERLVRLALAEDLGPHGDCTTAALVPEEAAGRAAVVVRQSGVIAGLGVAEVVLSEVDRRLQWTPQIEDGAAVAPGACVARIEGPARGLLTAERTLLNFLGRLSGIATLTRKYVQAVSGTKARIYDTRKTTPGWRRLEKCSVRAGGGCNHRTGLYDALLVKDNHLAFAAGAASRGGLPFSPADAVFTARQWLADRVPEPLRSRMIVEIEVDRLEQLEEVLAAGPDLVLLDNMSPARLRGAVALRDAHGPRIELEASGGVSLETVRAIAETGVDRISVGALTHGAVSLDIGLDWIAPAAGRPPASGVE